MGEWNRMRSLIEAGWHRDSAWIPSGMPPPEIDWDDTKQAQHDGERQIYGGLGTPQRED